MKFRLTAILSVVLIVLSFSQILNFYFWHDDYTHLYKAQQDIISSFPYGFFSTAVPFLYNQFGLNPTPYFVVAIGLYFATTLLLYFLSLEIFKNKLAACLTTLLFASGYIGQGSIIMFLGDGIGVLPVLPLVILSLLLFLKYLNQKKSIYLFLNYLLVFVILQTAPQRFVGLFVPFILLDWIYWFSLKNKKIEIKQVLQRNFLFVLIFFLVFGAHQSRSLAEVFSYQNFLVQIGNFWNFVFPSPMMVKLGNFFLLPAYCIFVIIFWFQNYKKRVFNTIAFTLINLVAWSLVKTPEIISGVLLIGIIILALVNKIRGKVMLVSLVLVGGLVTFFIAAALETIDSSYRYFMAYSFASAIFTVALLKNKKSKITLILPIFLMIILRIISARETQSAFYNNYVVHFKKIYASLKAAVPTVSSPTLFYMEGTTKELNFAVGDALRTGELPPEAAFGTHYSSPMKFIIWPETMAEIPKLAQQRNLNLSAIHTFRYNGENLLDTSFITRDMIVNTKNYERKYVINSSITTPYIIFEDYGDLDKRIYSQTTRTLKLDVNSLSTKESSFQIQWDYDGYGPLDAIKSFDFVLRPNERKTVEFDISAGGEYISQIRLTTQNQLPANTHIYSLSAH